MKLRHIFFTFLTITLPFVFLMNAVILFFTPPFLKMEYEKADFPPDPYGMTLEEREKYGSDSLLYITKNYDDSFMEEMTFPDETPFYNEREVSHMRDVRILFQKARAALGVIMILYVAIAWLVVKNPDSVPECLKALERGGILTLGIMVVIVAAILIDFDGLFTAFHHLFFTGSSWLFYASDSLIRLYPEKLWVDSFTYVAITTFIFSLLVILIARMFAKKKC